MDEEKKRLLEQSIEEQCFGVDSVLDDFRDRYFNYDHYKKFYDTVRQYHELIKDMPEISRKTAGRIWMVDTFFNATYYEYHERREKPRFWDQLQSVYDEWLDLMLSIFDPE
jgi:hypothetical protein